MHCGSINGDTAAARVLSVLRELDGGYISTWDLGKIARTPAVGTRVSECNEQLKPLQEEVVDCWQAGKGFYYRLSKKNEQIPLLLVS